MFQTIQDKLFQNNFKLASTWLLVLSVLIPILTINSNGFNYLGLAISFISTGILFFFLGDHPNKFKSYSLISLLVLSLFVVLRANALLLFFDFVLLIYLLALVIYPTSRQSNLNFRKVVVLPIVLLVGALSVKNKYNLFWFWRKKANLDQVKSGPKFSFKLIGQYLLGVLFSIILLLIIIPVLASANPFFREYITNFFRLFDWEFIVNLITQIFSIDTIIKFIFAVVLIVLLPRLASFAIADKTNPKSYEPKDRLFLLIPKIAVAGLIAIFMVAQVQLYTATKADLANLGYSYGELVNEVFGQLSFVTLIIFGLIYVERFRRKLQLKASVALIIEGLLLVLVALKSDLDYIISWGFTHKRLYGLAVIAWLTGIYLLFSYLILRKKSDNWLLKYSFAWLTLIFMLINLFNFDYLIYQVNKPRESDREPIEYYTTLSTDSGAYADILNSFATREVLVNQPISYGYGNKIYKYSPNTRLMSNRIKYLQNKYKNLNWLEFNVSEYRQYLLVKDVDTSKYFEAV